MIICEICDEQYNNAIGLQNHIRQTHKLTSQLYYDTYIKINNEGICKICGKSTAFMGLTKGYRIYCSKKCASNDFEVIKRTQQTCIDKYGVSNPLNTKEAQEKAKNTCVERYGVICPLSAPIVREKIKATNREKYGNDNVLVSKYGKEKSKQTLQNKYGVDNAIFIKGNLEKVNSKEAKNKMSETKRKNGTFNTSKPEDRAYEQLISIFGIDNVKRNYKSEKYPHLCDFYIPSEDLYIELNLHWTHGGHWFDETNEEDISKLTIWKEKSKNSTYYKYAIKTWTNYDVIKRHDIEKLNHLVFWTEKEVKEWIKEKAIHL